MLKNQKQIRKYFFINNFYKRHAKIKKILGKIKLKNRSKLKEG